MKICRAVIYKGVIYDTLRGCILENGLSEQRFYSLKCEAECNGTIQIVDNILILDDIMSKLSEECTSLDSEMMFNYNYNGVLYNSIISYCRDTKTPFDLVYNRLKEGASSEEAVRIQTINTSVNQSFSFDGKQYDSISKCLRDLGIPVSTGLFCTRMKRYNETVVESLNYFVGLVKAGVYSEINYEGMHFGNLSEACSVLGLSFGGVIDYMKKHSIPVNSILDVYISKVVCRSIRYKDKCCPDLIRYKGKCYSNLISVCKAYNLDYIKVLDYRATHLSESIESILDYFIKVSFHFYVNGKGYSNLPEACKSLDITTRDVFNYKSTYPDLSLQDVLDLFSSNS